MIPETTTNIGIKRRDVKQSKRETKQFRTSRLASRLSKTKFSQFEWNQMIVEYESSQCECDEIIFEIYFHFAPHLFICFLRCSTRIMLNSKFWQRKHLVMQIICASAIRNGHGAYSILHAFTCRESGQIGISAHDRVTKMHTDVQWNGPRYADVNVKRKRISHFFACNACTAVQYNISFIALSMLTIANWNSCSSSNWHYQICNNVNAGLSEQ